MKRLLMLSGLPASGKTTYAYEFINEHKNYKRVNKDDIRTVLGTYSYETDEKIVINTERYMTSQILSNNYNVIVDDTNMGERYKNIWKDFCKSEEVYFTQKCINYPKNVEDLRALFDNDYNRSKSVGEGVILNMCFRYNLLTEYFNDKKIILCDIDGTIANVDHRLHYVKDKKWDDFFDAMYNDKPIFSIYDKMIKDVDSNNAFLVFVTGRPERYREMTIDWLKKYYNLNRTSFLLFMRSNGDYRKDFVTKEYFLEKLFRDFNIIRIYDDRPSVIRMWKENGLEVVDCGDGEEF